MAIESVLAQTYTHWELVCVNDASQAPHIKMVLDEMARRDDRIRVLHCPQNRGVSVATNLGIELARGDYIGFMGHDDALEPHALHHFASAVLRDGPDLLYSDEAVYRREPRYGAADQDAPARILVRSPSGPSLLGSSDRRSRRAGAQGWRAQ